MIFVTVGTQLPFDRLVDAMNDWASAGHDEVIAQAGPTAAAGRWPHLDARTRMTPEDFERCFSDARIVVGHAGIGTILSAQRFRKPLVILPRRESLGEHRNDHQMATAREVSRLKGVYIAWNDADLPDLLQRDLAPAVPDGGESRSHLIDRIRTFIETG